MPDVHIPFNIKPSHPLIDENSYRHATMLSDQATNWLNSNCEHWFLYTDITWGDIGNGHKAALWDHLVIRFSNAEDAVLFKLTWL